MSFHTHEPPDMAHIYRWCGHRRVESSYALWRHEVLLTSMHFQLQNEPKLSIRMNVDRPIFWRWNFGLNTKHLALWNKFWLLIAINPRH